MGLYESIEIAWWRHQMETFSALLALYAENSPVTGEFPAQWPVTRSFDVFFDLNLNKRLSKQSWGWYLRRHRAHYDGTVMVDKYITKIIPSTTKSCAYLGNIQCVLQDRGKVGLGNPHLRLRGFYSNTKSWQSYNNTLVPKHLKSSC